MLWVVWQGRRFLKLTSHEFVIPFWFLEFIYMYKGHVYGHKAREYRFWSSLHPPLAFEKKIDVRGVISINDR